MLHIKDYSNPLSNSKQTSIRTAMAGLTMLVSATLSTPALADGAGGKNTSVVKVPDISQEVSSVEQEYLYSAAFLKSISTLYEKSAGGSISRDSLQDFTTEYLKVKGEMTPKLSETIRVSILDMYLGMLEHGFDVEGVKQLETLTNTLEQLSENRLKVAWEIGEDMEFSSKKTITKKESGNEIILQSGSQRTSDTNTIDSKIDISMIYTALLQDMGTASADNLSKHRKSAARATNSESEVRKRDQTIAGLNTDVSALKSRVVELEGEYANLKKTSGETLTEELGEKDKFYKEKLGEKSEEIVRLGKRIIVLESEIARMKDELPGHKQEAVTIATSAQSDLHQQAIALINHNHTLSIQGVEADRDVARAERDSLQTEVERLTKELAEKGQNVEPEIIIESPEIVKLRDNYKQALERISALELENENNKAALGKVYLIKGGLYLQ